MVWPEGLLPDAPCTMEERFCFLIPALFLIENRQAVKCIGHLAMVWPECLFPDAPCSLEERFCFLVPALLIIENRQAIKRVGDLGMVWPEGLLPDAPGAREERFRFLILTLLTKEDRQAVKQTGDLGMVWSQGLFPDAAGALEKWFCLCIVCLVIQIACCLLQQGSKSRMRSFPSFCERYARQYMRDETLTLSPCFRLCFRERSIQDLDDMGEPVLPFLFMQAIFDHSLHKSMHADRLALGMTPGDGKSTENL